MKEKIMNILKKFAITVIGGTMVGLGVNLFYVPVHILGGGLTAIAILAHSVLGTNIAIFTLILNIPVLILGYFFVDKEFMILSTIGMLCMTATIRLTENIPVPSHNLFTCIVSASLIVGVGAGIMLRQNSSCGGIDVLCRILFKYYSFPMGNTSLIVNGVILCFGVYFLGLDIVAATIVMIFILGRVINYMVEGIDYKRTVIIITNHAEEIANGLMDEFGRGVTITEAIGAYSGETRKQIMCAINPYQTPKLRNLVLKIDSSAFVTITESISVIGGGFKDRTLR